MTSFPAQITFFLILFNTLFGLMEILSTYFATYNLSTLSWSVIIVKTKVTKIDFWVSSWSPWILSSTFLWTNKTYYFMALMLRVFLLKISKIWFLRLTFNRLILFCIFKDVVNRNKLDILIRIGSLLDELFCLLKSFFHKIIFNLKSLLIYFFFTCVPYFFFLALTFVTNCLVTRSF